MKPINILNKLYESVSDNSKQKFIDYCKGKIKNLGTVKVKTDEVVYLGYGSHDDKKSYNIRVDYISSDGTKALNPEDTLDAFGTENTYKFPNGNVMDGGDMDAGQLFHIAELDFKYIDTDFYNDLLDNWEEWDMPMIFGSLNESAEIGKMTQEEFEEIIDTLGLNDTQAMGGIIRFRNVKYGLILSLYDKGLIDLDEKQNSGPSIGEMLKFNENPGISNMTFDGYVVIPSRSDSRITIDGINFDFTNEVKDEVEAFLENADEKEISENHAEGWWD